MKRNSVSGVTTLTLVDGDTFDGRSDRGSIMIVRECYEQLAEIVFSTINAKWKVLLTGTPGIGKSFFLSFICYKILQTDPAATIIFQDAEKTRLLINGFMATRGHEDSFEMELASTETWYLVDGCMPQGVEAKTILVTSPNPEYFKRWQKHEKVKKYLMPVWSFEELEACWSLLYRTRINAFTNAAFAFDVLRERWLKFGGVPRTVLFKWEEEFEEELQIALGRSNLDAALAAVGKAGIQTGVSDMLMHIRVDKDFVKSYYTPASAYIRKQIVNDFRRQRKGVLKDFVRDSEDIKELSTLRGDIF
ncbi:hypothetical protein HK104_006471 [Borealophlyctis nickersoniae]|nr:hypothetical protein HK104_006471 [Borealophlyctis nickersoniae]